MRARCACALTGTGRLQLAVFRHVAHEIFCSLRLQLASEHVSAEKKRPSRKKASPPMVTMAHAQATVCISIAEASARRHFLGS